MKIVGLVVEYNPFHNGHLHHIKESIATTNADYAIVVMSGDYVQRGGPAIMPKHIRTQMALACGASLVIELPVRYATSSAENFALGAVSLLHSLGCVDTLCFGSECGDVNVLRQIAEILITEPLIYRNILQSYLKKGLTFPKARESALIDYVHEDNPTSLPLTELQMIISSPNNILGIEYIKALMNLKSDIIPYTIPRISSNYHDTHLQENYSSATAIRNEISKIDQKIDLTHLNKQLPQPCLDLLTQNYNITFPITSNDFSLLLHQKLLQETKESLLQYEDITIDLANRIINHRNQYLNFDQFCDLLKTKNFTLTRINRALLHVLLDIFNYETTMKPATYITPYIRILGFKKQHHEILSEIKKDAKIPLITKLTAIDFLSHHAIAMIRQDIYAANLYQGVVTHLYQTPFINEFEQSIIIR